MPAQAEPGRQAGGDRWSDLRLRVLSAAVLLPVALHCLYAGGIAWNILVLAATLGLLWEWWRMRGACAPARTCRKS